MQGSKKNLANYSARRNLGLSDSSPLSEEAGQLAGTPEQKAIPDQEIHIFTVGIALPFICALHDPAPPYGMLHTCLICKLLVEEEHLWDGNTILCCFIFPHEKDGTEVKGYWNLKCN